MNEQFERMEKLLADARKQFGDPVDFDRFSPPARK